jgi:hypothetical protein
MSEALLVVSSINAALTGCLLSVFLAKLSGQIQLLHAKGETLQGRDLAGCSRMGDALRLPPCSSGRRPRWDKCPRPSTGSS